MKKLYIHGGKSYIIIRRVWDGKFLDKIGNPDLDKLKTFRDWCNADHVLRDQTHYLFCETINDVEFVELNKE
jgi:hypothetical protein